MVFVVLYKYGNCAVDKTMDTGYTTSTDCNTNYRIILLMMLSITPSCKPLKTGQSKEIRTYATWLKPSFTKCTPW